MSYILRSVEPDESGIVLHHRRQMFLNMGFTREPLEEAIAASERLFAESLRNGRYCGYFALDETGEIVAGGGVILFDFHASPRDRVAQRAWIVNMYTEPAHRRRGLARTIINALIDFCRESGWPGVYLHASADGESLYKSLGFKSTNEMRLDLLQPTGKNGR